MKSPRNEAGLIVDRLLHDDAPSWPTDAPPQGAQPILYVAFAYDPVINTPAGHDPRQYRAGDCLGAFATREAARKAVNAQRPLTEWTPWWDQKYCEDDPTVFLRSKNGTVFLGYVEEVPLERRVQERRK